MNTPIRVLIADDETSARRRLLQFLADESNVSVIAECRDGNEACSDIARLKPDLVFLDVEMPECGGLDVVRCIGVERMPATIFATAYDHYALSAFNANAMDYLLKPFDRDRFTKAMVKARAWIDLGKMNECRTQITSVITHLDFTRKYMDRILVKSGESQLLIRVVDILFIAAEGNYVRLHTDGASHLMRESLVGMLERLDPRVFRRIHRSHIVNLDHVKKLLPWFGGDNLLMMANGSRLTISRNFRDAMKDFI